MKSSSLFLIAGGLAVAAYVVACSPRKQAPPSTTDPRGWWEQVYDSVASNLTSIIPEGSKAP